MGFDVPMPSPDRIKADIDHLKEWILKEAHLPKIDDDRWLETFLCNNKFSLEKTKFKLERYYSLRTKYPEILKNRDGTSSDILQSCEVVKLACSNILTRDNSRILFVKYGPEASTFDGILYSKRLFMIFDLLLLDEENRLKNLINIVDLQDLRYLHVLKLLAVMPKLSEIFNHAYTPRLKAVHLINLPPFAVKFIEMCKKYFPQKLADRFITHPPSGRTLFEMVDENAVCNDFGGKGPSLTELQDMTMKNIQKHRKWFEEQDEICSNEVYRMKTDDRVDEIRGSFKKLEVD